MAYLTAPSQMLGRGTVIETGMDERGRFLICDETPAYPQGGGQEADQGFIQTDEGSFPFTDVRFDNGIVKHYLNGASLPLIQGNIVEIHINPERRRINSILHTAGHLIASITYLEKKLLPTKGHHFLSGSYVELSGELNIPTDDFKNYLQEKVNREIQLDRKVSFELITYEELGKRCPFIQEGIPVDKALRVVDIEGYFPIACGGTHVDSLNEIPTVNITKVKSGKGIMRISYNCTNKSI